MEGSHERCKSIVNKAVTTVEVEGSSYFVLRKDDGKGDRRRDGRVMAEIFTGVDAERLKKKRMLYDPSPRIVRKNPKEGNNEEARVLR